jgi:hypothetical protein
MKSWVKWIGIGAMGLFASAATAADHTDGSMAGVDGQPAADISDVYAWLKDDGQTLVLIQNIVGASHSDAVQYVFHIGRAADAGGALAGAPTTTDDIICEFAAGGDISCWAGGEYVTGDASGADGVSNAAGTLKVHAGSHADPFFFHLQGFETAIATANAAGTYANGAGKPAGYLLGLDAANCPTTLQTSTVADLVTEGLLNSSSCPNGTTVGNLLLGMLDGTYTDADCTNTGGPVDTFAALNVSSIVMEIDLSLLTGADPYLQVWGSTHTKPGS